MSIQTATDSKEAVLNMLAKGTELNDEQKAAILAEENTVVAAGAGSGKTTVLANRFAYLVTHGTKRHPNGIAADRILTLTFTKKAAAEMYSRIYQKLLYLSQNTEGEIRQRAQRAVDSFGDVHIQTLDSYCSTVVRKGANRYGIRPDFAGDPQSGETEQRIRQMALQFLMEHRTQPAVQTILGTKSPEAAAEYLFIEPVITYSTIDHPVLLQPSLKKQVARVCTDWQALVSDFCSLIEEVREHSHDNNLTEKLKNNLEQFFAQYPDISCETITGQSFHDYISLIEQAPAGHKTLAAQTDKYSADLLAWLEAITALPSTTAKNNAVYAPLCSARDIQQKILDLALFIIQYGLLADLTPLIEQFQMQCLEWKRQSGALTFQDIANLAVTILTEQKDIRQNEKLSFDAVMIDEFQDNNNLQKNLLYLLAEQNSLCCSGIPEAKDLCPDKLFFVGDEKQSIYSFRGGDVSVFRTLQNELSGGKSLCLKNNYRSNASLIQAFNLLFTGMLTEQEEQPDIGRASIFLHATDKILPLYEAKPEPAAIPASKCSDPITPHTHICLYVNQSNKSSSDEDESEPAVTDEYTDCLSAQEQEAVFTVQQIHKLIKEGTYTSRDIAILLRTKTHQHLYEKYLRTAGIPYVTENISSFFADAPVNDMLHFLRLLAYPDDLMSYSAVLSSPFAGLSLAGTAECIRYTAAEKKASGAGSCTPFDEQAEELLSATDRQHYRTGRETYKHFTELVHDSSLTDLISSLWHETGYRYETIWAENVTLYQELYQYLYELARIADQNGLTLAAFADSLYQLSSNDGKLDDISIPLARPPAVTIITIHKSKGLQYPVVFVCGAGSKTLNSTNNNLICKTKDGELIIQPPHHSAAVFKDIKSRYFIKETLVEQKAKAVAEQRRLLYVALTRAEKELYITANITAPNSINTDTESLEGIIKQYTKEKFEKQTENDSSSGLDSIPVYRSSSCAETVIHYTGSHIDLLLPAIKEWLPVRTEYPLFTLEQIPSLTRNQALAQLSPGRKHTAEKTDIQQKALPLYQHAAAEELPLLRTNRRTPSSLSEKTESQSQQDCRQPSAYPEIDRILSKYQQETDGGDTLFTPTDFGTVAHECAEALFTRKPIQLDSRIAAKLTPSEQKTVLTAAQTMAERFAASPLGQKALHADWLRSEYAFRSIVKQDNTTLPVYIDGKIDLLFRCGDTLYIVDFKTDFHIQPEHHVPQLACYQTAALQFAQLQKCCCWLYYLRYDTAENITDKVQSCVWQKLL